MEAVCLEPGDFLRAKAPIAPGGGLVGTVREVGEAATAFAGARVLVAPVQACGECDTCRRGFATVCPSRTLLGQDTDGGSAELVVAHSRWLTRLDEGLEIPGPTAALVAGPALLAYACHCRAGVSAGDLVVVLGSGPAAMILSALAASRGAKVVSASGEQASRSIEAELASIDAKGRPQKIFVCDGRENLSTAVQVATPGSLIVTTLASETIDMQAVVDSELSLIGLSKGHPDLMTETAALVVKGELDLAPYYLASSIADATEEATVQATADGKCLVAQH